MKKEEEEKRKKELSSEDLARLELLQKASEKTGKQLTIGEAGDLKEIDEIKQLVVVNDDNEPATVIEAHRDMWKNFFHSSLCIRFRCLR